MERGESNSLMRTALRIGFRVLRAIAALAGGALLLACIAFAIVQTPRGRAWLAQTVTAAASHGKLRLSIRGIGGLVPFRFTVERVGLADPAGTFGVMHDVVFVMPVAPLLRRHLEIRTLAAREADFTRLPHFGPPPSLARILHLLRPPQLPLTVTLDRLAIARVAFGKSAAATLVGRMVLNSERGAAALDLHRIDGHRGYFELATALSGPAPRLKLHVKAEEATGRLVDRVLHRGDHLPLSLSLAGNGPLGDWHGRLDVSAGPGIRIDTQLAVAATHKIGLRATGTAAVAPLLPANLATILGGPIGFALRATKDADRFALNRLRVVTAAGRLTGTAELAAGSEAPVAARLTVDVPRLQSLGVPAAGAAMVAATFGGSRDRPVFDVRLALHEPRLASANVSAAAMQLSAHGSWERTAGFKATFAGSAVGLHSGLAAARALLGDDVSFGGAIRRGPAGTFHLERIALAGAGARLSGSGSFAPDSGRLAADLALAVPRLAPLGGRLAGAVEATARLTGPFDRLRLDAVAIGHDLAFDRARLDRLKLAVTVTDLAEPKALLDGTFRSGGLAGGMSLAAKLDGRADLVLPRLRVAAAGGTVDGALRVALATGRVVGRVEGRIPDLAAWSKLAGMPLTGSGRFAATLAAERGQTVDLLATGSGLAVEDGSARLTVDHSELRSHLANPWQALAGNGRLELTGVHSGSFSLAGVSLVFDSERPGRFAFRGGVAGATLRLVFAGDAGRKTGALLAYEMRLARLDGSIASERLRLEQPLIFSWRSGEVDVSGLDADFGAGRVHGRFYLSERSLAINLSTGKLPLAPLAQAAGHSGVDGTLSLTATVGGTFAAPHGELTAAIEGLGFGRRLAAGAPRLALALTGDWDGRRLSLDGHVAGLDSEHIRVKGSLPLLLSRNPLGIGVPRDGRLALDLDGAGEVGPLADLLPIGENRLTGRFAADLSLSGTVGAPNAQGRLNLTHGRFENIASGAVLTGLDATLTGDRNRLTLTSLSAGDDASGRISGSGGITLAGQSGPSANLVASLNDFRIAARDEALVTASGRITVTGPLRALSVVAPLTIERADIDLPTRLPPDIVVIHVVRIDRATGRPAAPTPAARPIWPASLDLTLDMPGRVFVRGHGLDSEWRGRLRITGSTVAPRIAGTLAVVHGSYSFLGKSFQLTQGRIIFDGGSRPDPMLDITAQVVASDITAEIKIGGLASALKISLTSVPPLPQDEILSRVLFNQGKGQLSAAQGLELAQAAAALAGQNFGVLDRLRGSLGLDWLGFGSGPQGAAPSIVNPNPNSPQQQNNSATVVSAGKYIARGISVGVTQGVSPPTSKVVVEIQLGNHVTVDTSAGAGQNGGTGIGINYNFNY